MKPAKQIATLLLVLVLALTLVACGSQKEEKLLGTWQTELDFTKAVEKGLTGEGAMDSSMLPTDTKIVATLTVTLEKDQTCNIAIAVDKDSFSEYILSLSDALVEMLYKAGDDAGISREDFETAFESQYGMDVKGYVDHMLEDYDTDALLSDANFNEDGYWKVENGKLRISEDKDFSGDDIDEITYHFDGEKLIFDTFAADDDSFAEFEDLGITPPWTLTKK